MVRDIGLFVVLAIFVDTLASCRRHEATPDTRALEHLSMDARIASEDATTRPDASPAHPIFNDCVLHAGNVNVQRQQARFADGGVGPQVVSSGAPLS